MVTYSAASGAVPFHLSPWVTPTTSPLHQLQVLGKRSSGHKRDLIINAVFFFTHLRLLLQQSKQDSNRALSVLWNYPGPHHLQEQR